MTRRKKWTHNENAGEILPCCGKPLGKYEDYGLHRCKPLVHLCTRCGHELNLDDEMEPDMEPFKGVDAYTMLKYAKTIKQVRHARGYLCTPPTTDF